MVAHWSFFLAIWLASKSKESRPSFLPCTDFFNFSSSASRWWNTAGSCTKMDADWGSPSGSAGAFAAAGCGAGAWTGSVATAAGSAAVAAAGAGVSATASAGSATACSAGAVSAISVGVVSAGAASAETAVSATTGASETCPTGASSAANAKAAEMHSKGTTLCNRFIFIDIGEKCLKFYTECIFFSHARHKTAP